MGGAQRALISAFYVWKTRHLQSGASSPSPSVNGTNPRRNDSTANRRSTTQLLEAELKQRFTLLYHDRTTAVNCTNLRALKKKKNYTPLPSFHLLYVQKAGASELRGNSKTGRQPLSHATVQQMRQVCSQPLTGRSLSSIPACQASRYTISTRPHSSNSMKDHRFI